MHLFKNCILTCIVSSAISNEHHRGTWQCMNYSLVDYYIFVVSMQDNEHNYCGSVLRGMCTSSLCLDWSNHPKEFKANMDEVW